MLLNRIVDVSIILMAMIGCYGNLWFYWKYHKTNPRHWVRLWYAIIGFYWAGIFTYILFDPPITNPRLWHSAVIEPAIMLTLSAIAASAIMRMKLYKEGQ